ncbi:MAG TPA: RNA-binding transcriptional accessory protein [Candidatus Onthocola stercorigallinarum]|nr:RNA-binding transcriptional accessory protein [Candidatus Onthocola stercorigallinarum]
MNEEVINKVSSKINLGPNQIKAVINMLSEGATIPFIARYRKEVTGNLNEEELRLIETEYNYAVNLQARKDDVKRLIDEKGMLTPELVKAIDEATRLSEVEDIYAPFKEKRKTKGTEAIKMGLEPLAKIIMSLPNKTRDEVAKDFLNESVKTIDDAITNAGYIIADWISDNPKYRKYIRKYYWYNGVVTSKLKKNAEDPNKVYEIYYNFEAKITNIKPHQILAINRAEKEKIVTYSLSVDSKKVLEYLHDQVIGNKKSPLISDMEAFIMDAWKRLLEPSLERDIKAELFDKASEFGIEEFGNNLENLLLTPPIKGSVVMGFDPAFRTGCKLAVLSPTGEVLEIGVIYPHEPKKEVDMAEKIMLALIGKHNVKIIAIGNGTASRESEAFVANLIKKYNLDVKYVIVSEAGASVYSASPLAKREFPDYSVEQRSAVSIGRRLQDALSELVKIDPKSIGVGLYQHDLKQKELDEELSFVVSKIVNKVGVNLNNASESILNYVSGLNKSIIKKILDYRKKNGVIKSRSELESVEDNAKAFEQSAGFLRIFNGDNPLDKTNIHPEDYDIVNKILGDYKIDVSLVGTSKMQEEINKLNDKEILEKYNISEEKWQLIKDNLVNGVIDPRDEIKQMTLRSDILSIDDLELGMELEGTVRNVTAFGAFVDIGLHDDALIHISKMSKGFVKHPSEILKVGDIINVHICGIEKDKGRVSLSLIEE